MEDEDANNVGYILLSAERFEEATALFNRCLDTKDLDNETAALALYNRAISYLACLQLKDAHDALTEAQARLDSSINSKHGCRCLFVPSLDKDLCILVEQPLPELNEAIAEAQRVLSSGDATISAIELRPAAWPTVRPEPD